MYMQNQEPLSISKTEKSEVSRKVSMERIPPEEDLKKVFKKVFSTEKISKSCFSAENISKKREDLRNVSSSDITSKKYFLLKTHPLHREYIQKFRHKILRTERTSKSFSESRKTPKSLLERKDLQNCSIQRRSQVPPKDLLEGKVFWSPVQI